MKATYILAIESSCDETAAAVVKNGKEVLSNVIYSQIALHTVDVIRHVGLVVAVDSDEVFRHQRNGGILERRPHVYVVHCRWD